jgi:hypothetical protein
MVLSMELAVDPILSTGTVAWRFSPPGGALDGARISTHGKR